MSWDVCEYGASFWSLTPVPLSLRLRIPPTGHPTASTHPLHHLPAFITHAWSRLPRPPPLRSARDRLRSNAGIEGAHQSLCMTIRRRVGLLGRHHIIVEQVEGEEISPPVLAP
jgi:hypothetical protein